MRNSIQVQDTAKKLLYKYLSNIPEKKTFDYCKETDRNINCSRVPEEPQPPCNSRLTTSYPPAKGEKFTKNNPAP
jgi:hypothetical protein